MFGGDCLTFLFFRTLIFYLILTVLVRIMGKRQLGELQVGEFIVTMMLSDIAVIPITDGSIPLLHGIIPALVLTSLELILSYLCSRSRRMRRVIEGTPVVLMARGVINEDALDATHTTVEELFSQLRQLGYSDISEVNYIIFEPCGKLSVILKSKNAPLTVGQAGFSSEESGLSHTIVIEGEVNEEALRLAGKSKEWLERKLIKSNTSLDEILYMTVDDCGKSKVELRRKKKR